jgi:histone deacetylase 1/2
LLEKVGMLKYKSAPTPLSFTYPLSLVARDPLGSEDSTQYRIIVVALQYLTLTRPDLAFSVNIYQYLHAPTTVHWTTINRILRYVKDTINIGITFQPSKSTFKVPFQMQIGLVALMVDILQVVLLYS